MSEWCDKGWVNIQKWAFDKFGNEIRATCKGVTTKDHVFVSPQLAAYLKSVHVEDDWFADHSLLYATFHPLGKPPIAPLWRQPVEIPWEDCPALPDQPEADFVLPQTDPSDKYQAICHEFESRVDAALQTKGKQLASTAKGRAATRETRTVQEFAHPPKKGRQGDVAPEYSGTNLRHAQMLRQVRRLTNYQRVCNLTSLSPAQVEYRSDVWRKILKAPGFSSNFRQWWENAQHPDFPVLPVAPPSGALVNHVLDQSLKELREFEASLMKTRTSEAKQRRLQDANIIFRDLQKEPAAQVQILLENTKAKITVIDHEQSALELDKPQPWKPDVPIQCKDKSIVPIYVESDKISVDNLEGFQEGDVVRQETPVGSLQELFQMFGREWRTRWDKHAEVDESTWDPICQFADLALPHLPPMPYEPITYAEWTKTLKQKSRKAATGPDAMSRQDLLKMPKDLTLHLLDLFHHAEQTGEWPEQLLVGFVVALEKQQDSKFVNQFRPITVFPTAYRTYTSIRARQILRFLNPHMPATCTGNLPNRYASQMWHSIMDQIELGVHQVSDLSGGVIDLVKAFNTLPRVPIMAVMKRLNIPVPILRAWSHATIGMKRRFKIHNKVGPPEMSTTGYAEGCALSCVAMLGFNILNHCWCALKEPRIQLWSYVDNIEVVGHNAAHVISGMQELSRFCAGMDVSIDTAKSYTWSINAGERKELRENEQNIVHHIRDLGCHMQYTRKVTNFTVTEKMAQIAPLWNKLSRSLAPYRAKIRALRSKAWPACLHAISAVHVADEHFTKLRTGALRGIGEHTNGMSPSIHLGLVEHPLTDPQFYAIFTTVTEYRVLGKPDVFVTVMESLHRPGPNCYPKPGPASVLLSRLHQLAWSWIAGTVFADDRGLPCDIMFAPIQELRIRLAESWQHRTQTDSSGRRSMQGLERAHAALTLKAMPHLPPEDPAILRTSLNGSFFTADKYYAQGKLDTPACAFCGQPDSQEHRHWYCEHFATCRHATPAQIQTLAGLDTCLKAHGWMPEPPSLQAFRHAVVTATPTWDYMTWPPTLPDVLHLFTDGACLVPQCPWSRLGSWGVALGSFCDENPWPLASGIVVGWVQSIVRAELSAVIAACHAGLQCGHPIVLWIDNELVFKRIKAMMQGTSWIKPNQKDADLWSIALQLIHALGPQLQQVCKVVSHQDHTKANTEADRWIFAGNDAADALATAAADNHPTLLQLWSHLQQDLANIQVLRQVVHRTIVDVGRHAIQSKPAKSNAQPVEPRIRHEDIVELALPDLEATQLDPKFVFPDVHRLLDWLPKLIDPAESPKLVSWFQLNALFEHQTGLKGLHYITKSKQWQQLAMQSDANFVQRANRLSRWLQGCINHHGGSCYPKHLRPQSQAIQFWTQCIQVRIPCNLLSLSDDLLCAHQPHFRTVQAVRGV